MKFIYLFIFIFLQYFDVIASDSCTVYLHNPFIKHKIEVYKYKTNKIEHLIYKTSTDRNFKKFNTPIVCYYDIGCKIEIYLFVKYKYFLSGRWIKINTSIQKDKILIIFYSKERKAKYCYDYIWVTKDEFDNFNKPRF